MKVKKPLISVITVVLNGEKTIERTINSVISQNFNSFEYIIIDGGSTDGTLELINKYSSRNGYHKIDKWTSEKDNGIYDAMNKGARIAQGDYVFFLNADDFFVKNDVLLNVAKELRNKKTDILYGKVEFLKNGVLFTVKHPRKGENVISYLKKGQTLNHQGIFTKRKLLLKYSFDTSYKLMADHDLICRMLKDNASFYLSEIVISRFSTGGLSKKNPKLCLDETKKMIKKNFGKKDYLIYLIFYNPFKELAREIGLFGIWINKFNPQLYKFLKSFKKRSQLNE